jgi:hypothetical protein
MVGAGDHCGLISPAVARAHLHEPETCKRRKYLYPSFRGLLANSISIALSGRTPRQNGAPLSYVYLAVNPIQFSINLTC